MCRILVLSRQHDETITITLEDARVITISVVRLRASKVRLGITAPPTVSVMRTELLEPPQEIPT